MRIFHIRQRKAQQFKNSLFRFSQLPAIFDALAAEGLMARDETLDLGNEGRRGDLIGMPTLC